MRDATDVVDDCGMWGMVCMQKEAAEEGASKTTEAAAALGAAGAVSV